MKESVGHAIGHREELQVLRASESHGALSCGKRYLRRSDKGVDQPVYIALPESSWLLLPATAVLSYVLTGLVRRYAMSRELLDHPNERSSHLIATPRGGGVAIVVAFLAGLLISENAVTDPTTIALFISGIGVAAVGFADDHGHIPARWRLLAHFSCAAWILFWIGTPRIEWLGITVDLGGLGIVLVLVYLVWMLNLYNFMDGIDGIAAIEAVTVGIGGILVNTVGGMSLTSDLLLPSILAAAALGFLAWNYPPAKIFMGDAGSGFLGLMFGALSIHAAVAHPVLLWSWLVVLGVFVVDATTTLLRRLLRGERIYEAHRSHAYQHASREFGTHRPVTLAVAGINLLWLLPWGLAIAAGQVAGVVGLVIAYCPLLALALRFESGRP